MHRPELANLLARFFSAEGLHSLEGKRENLDKLYDAGMRMAGLTHFFDNELAGSMHGEAKGGLTEFGREIMAAMEDMGMIIDIAHLSHAGVKEVLATARRPVVSSHGGAQATCNVNRNLSDEEIKGVAKTGGIIGVGYWEGAVCDTDPKAVAKAMKHIRDLVGVEHVALGSDYDGAVTTRFDTSGLVHITQALMDIGFTNEEIRAAMGGNAISVITSGLVPFRAPTEGSTNRVSIPIIHHGDTMPEGLRGGVAALGNFDGFHLGHQAVASAAIAKAGEEKRSAIIATFDPHPVRHFAPHVPPFRLTTLGQRREIFEAAGADAMLVFDFGDELAATTAEGFIAKLLVEHLGLSAVVTGEDFTFGKARGGNIGVLRDFGGQHNLQSIAVGPVEDEGGVISSSRVRDALKAGDVAAANRLLTRPFAVRGTVQHGDKNGRLLGFPTANIDMDHYLRPRYGIYAVRGILPDGTSLDGAANMGIRPSFDPPKELLEPHFFGFDGELYGQEIEVEFHAFIRPEAKFDDMDSLKEQMYKDCEEAKKLLA